MKRVGHFDADDSCSQDSGIHIFNPSNGRAAAVAAIGISAEADRAVATARAAFPTWSAQGPQNRAAARIASDEDQGERRWLELSES
jgi:malonate-semialdehyde dehydrogenase (acetylating) / methylmalonate-semialdehyde dehydrogenase